MSNWKENLAIGSCAACAGASYCALICLVLCAAFYGAAMLVYIIYLYVEYSDESCESMNLIHAYTIVEAVAIIMAAMFAENKKKKKNPRGMSETGGKFGKKHGLADVEAPLASDEDEEKKPATPMQKLTSLIWMVAIVMCIVTYTKLGDCNSTHWALFVKINLWTIIGCLIALGSVVGLY